MGKTFAEMQEMYREVVKRFNKIELQEWRADHYKIDLERAFIEAREDECRYLQSRNV